MPKKSKSAPHSQAYQNQVMALFQCCMRLLSLGVCEKIAYSNPVRTALLSGLIIRVDSRKREVTILEPKH